MNILIPLGAFLASSAGAIAKRVLGALGIGVISYAAISTAFEQALDYAQDQFSGLPSAMFNLAALAGVGEALGIITAAITFRVSLTVQRKVLGVLSK